MLIVNSLSMVAGRLSTDADTFQCACSSILVCGQLQFVYGGSYCLSMVAATV